MTVTRNPGFQYYLPTEDEWYKAAYYDPKKGAGGGYWLYPTKSDNVPLNTLPDTGNHANYYDETLGPTLNPPNTTPVGSFAKSPSAYGTFDQGGDVWQWNETAVTFEDRGCRGGSFISRFRGQLYLTSTYRDWFSPTIEQDPVGFRIVTVPEPSTLALLGMGAISLLAYVRRRNRV